MLRQKEEVSASHLTAPRIVQVQSPTGTQSAQIMGSLVDEKLVARRLPPVRLNRKQKRVAFWVPLLYGLCAAAMTPVTESRTFNVLKIIELFASTGGLFLLLLWLGFFVRYKRAALAVTAWLYSATIILISIVLITLPAPRAPHSTGHHASPHLLPLLENLMLVVLLGFATAITGAWIGKKRYGHQTTYGATEER